jgi:hypothetical protein
MRPTRSAVWLGVIGGAALWGAVSTAAAAPVGYELAWADEFDGAALDPAKWGQHQPGPRRSAINVEEAAYADGAGHLVIDTWTQDDVHYTGMINTRDRFEPTYGWFEARIAFEDMAPGMWSAFWLQSPRIGSVIGDPGVSGVEIDVHEHRLECGPGCDLSNIWQGSLHWDGYGDDYKRASTARLVPGLGEGFHVYALEWTPAGYRFYVDGVLLWEPVNPPLSHTGQFVVLSSEVFTSPGFAGIIPEEGYGTRGGPIPRMRVDYVRVYQLVPEPGTLLLLATGLACLTVRRRTA